MKEITKVNIKYATISITGAVIVFLGFFFTYDQVVDAVPDGILGFLLFLSYTIGVFGIGIVYQFVLLCNYYKHLENMHISQKGKRNRRSNEKQK